MKVSDLIARLEALRAEHGDLEVWGECDGGLGLYTEDDDISVWTFTDEQRAAEPRRRGLEVPQVAIVFWQCETAIVSWSWQ